MSAFAGCLPQSDKTENKKSRLAHIEMQSGIFL